MARIIDGKDTAIKLRDKVKLAAAAFNAETGATPGLAVVLVGEDPASQVYVNNKDKQAQDAGFNSYQHKLVADTSEQELLSLIDRLNQDTRVHGILVQLPLPSHIREAQVIDRIHPDKDVDGFHVSNMGRLICGLPGFVPCTPLGCIMLLKSVEENLAGLHAVVVGRSNIVGKPMAALLLRENCTVTIAHSRTKALPEICRQADILVAAVGKAEMIKGEWIKEGALVIDVGINRVDAEQGKTRLVGDVQFSGAQQRAAAITPVPGGVGPMTIACLLLNTLTAAYRINGLTEPDIRL